MDDEPGHPARRQEVVRTALTVFSTRGYRRTSMDEVAAAAGISRPGLYFLFGSKRGLFVEAVTVALHVDLAAVERTLADPDRELGTRLVGAFDHWAGRYVGPLGDGSAVIEAHPDLLGDVPTHASERFRELVRSALREDHRIARPDDVADVLSFASQGIKTAAATRADYLARMEVAVDLLLGRAGVGSRAPTSGESVGPDGRGDQGAGRAR